MPLLVLLTWKLLTGGIHLDGLADSLDGLTGGDPERRRAIMKDSRVGVFGALGLIGALLIGLGTLAVLREPLRTRAVFLAPALGRLTPLVLARTFSPGTPGAGSGAAFMEGVTRGALGVGLILIAAASGVAVGARGLVASAVGLGMAWVVARFFARRYGGLTGDGLGAGVEVSELATLLALASFQHLTLL